MIVKVDPAEIRKFRRRVLRAYPNEHMELVWGKQVKLNVFHIHVFDQIKYIGVSDAIYYDDEQVRESAEEAKLVGLTLLGSIHSHPECHDSAPSEHDYDEALKAGELISGIALVCKQPNGRRSIRIRFWGPLHGVTPVHF